MIFDRATAAAADMAARLGTDVPTAAQLLGRALDDPINGYRALEENGISFTDGQVKQIRKMQESGKLLGAQKVLLDGVGRSVGGAARAQAQPMDRLRTTIGLLSQMFGESLLPTVNRVSRALDRFLRRLIDSGKVRKVFDGIRTALDVIGDGIEFLVKKVLPPLWPIFRNAFMPIIGLTRNLARVIRTVVRIFNSLIKFDFKEAWASAREIVSGAIDDFIRDIGTVTEPARRALSGIWEGLSDSAAQMLGGVGDTIKGAINDVIDILNDVIDKFNSLPGWVRLGKEIPTIGRIGDDAGPTSYMTTEQLFSPSSPIDPWLFPNKGKARAPKKQPLGPVPGRARSGSVTATHRMRAIAPVRPQSGTDIRAEASAAGGAPRAGSITIPLYLDGRVIARATARYMEELGSWA